MRKRKKNLIYPIIAGSLTMGYMIFLLFVFSISFQFFQGSIMEFIMQTTIGGIGLLWGILLFIILTIGIIRG